MRLEHPNIIRLYQVIDTLEEMYIIMEYAAGGELIDYIAAKGCLTENEGRKYFRDLIAAMDHCHLAGVVHRDLKLENMLLGDDKNLLLSDFGLGRSIFSTDQILNTFCGTPLYAGPELVSGIKYVGPTADIWSLGIVLYIMIAGKPPFRCETIAELYGQIKAVKYSCPKSFSPELVDLLSKLLVRDPLKRITMDELRMHTWISDGGKLDPPIRITPRIPVKTRSETIDLDNEIDSLLTGITELDGITVYNFASGENSGESSFAVKFESDEDTRKAISPSPTMSTMNGPPSLTTSNMDNISSSKSRRTSITAALGKLNFFGSRRQSGEAINQDPASQRQRSRSVVPGTGFAPGETPTVKPTPPPNAALAPVNHRRRHSVAVGVSEAPVELRPAIPIVRAQSRSSMAPNPRHGRRASVDTSNVSPTETASASNAGINGSQRITSSNSRSVAPSMELISEHEEDGHNHSVITHPSVNFGRASTTGSTTFGSNYHHSVPPIVTTANTANNQHQRRYSIWTDSPSSQSNGGTYGDIRSIRFNFQLQTLPSHVKDPLQVIAQVQIFFSQYSLSPGDDQTQNTIEKRGPFTVVAQVHQSTVGSTPGKVIIEVEVVRVWLLKMLAVKVKRLGGDALAYKSIYDALTAYMK